MALMMVIMELSRGNAESERKADLLSKNWKKWRQGGEGRVVGQTKRGNIRPSKTPFWLEIVGPEFQGVYRLRKGEPLAALRMMFELAEKGFGTARINERLAVKYPAHVLSGPGLKCVLRSPVVWGRCEELDRDDYFPPAITREQWERVQASVSSRNNGGGNPGRGEWVHLLNGLVWDGDKPEVGYQAQGQQAGNRVYFPSDYHKGKTTALTGFPVRRLELAVVAHVSELDPSALVPGDNAAERRLEALEAERGRLTAQLDKAEAELDAGGDLDRLVKVMRKWETRLAELVKKLADVRADVASPLGANLRECQRLAKFIADTPNDELRLKVRALLRRIVRRIDCWFYREGKWRFCYCRIRYHGSEQVRQLAVVVHCATRGRAEEWETLSAVGQGKALEDPHRVHGLMADYAASRELELGEQRSRQRKAKDVIRQRAARAK